MLKKSRGIVIAFSGGVDSTFLAAAAREALGDRVLLVTATSPTYPSREQAEAVRLARLLRIRQIVVESNELEIPGFAKNPVNRCYHCKKELFKIVRRIARKEGFTLIADGSNADDLGDYRPGRKAAKELGVHSPLMEAGLRKEDIRRFSRTLRLPTADKPSFACLASRFPYGSTITDAKLKAVDALETEARRLGFKQVRVRHHGDVARIEVEQNSIPRLVAPRIRSALLKAARAAGFTYIAADLAGYRTGSMNEGLGSWQLQRHRG
ncbi:MAG: TIGR00268 family protein [Verrucomicrobia bacterium]|nr:TIGR00268 family protein [Verrucomicrobiota bacterium]